MYSWLRPWMHGKMGCLYNARKIFDGMPMKDVVLWSSIISCYIENEEASEGLDLFHRMICQGVEPDSVKMLSVAEACCDLGFLRLARLVHGQVVTRTIKSEGSLDNSLIVLNVVIYIVQRRSFEMLLNGILLLGLQ